MFHHAVLVWRRPAISNAGRHLFSSAVASWTVHPETGLVSQNSKPLFQTIIGMEIHAQLNIPTKLLSSAPRTSITAKPNQAVWPLDVAVPGVLPRLAKDAVQAAVLTAAACNCEISHVSRFERKHYAYADLPLGYQVTQQRWPIARNGHLICRRRVDPKDKKKKKKQIDDGFVVVGIDRIQLEQDTGKTIAIKKREVAVDGKEYIVTHSLIDFNRAGCALVEIVFSPDIRSANDAASVLETLRDTMRFIGTCDGKMQEGSLRCDLNVSIARLEATTDDSMEDADNPFRDSLPPGTGHRVEVKNLNSIKQVAIAAQYEALRQAQANSGGKPTERETRTLDVRTGKTVLIRSKEGAVDYRFMPEPDLPPIVLNKDALNGMALDEFLDTTLPELPAQAAMRLMEDYNLSEDVALVITGDPPAVTMYELAVSAASQALCEKTTVPPKRLATTVANWLCNDVFGLVKENATGESDASVQDSRITARQLGELVAIVMDGFVSTTTGKKILSVMYHEEIGKAPGDIAEERGWQVITNLDDLRQICRDVIQLHDDQLQQYNKEARTFEK